MTIAVYWIYFHFFFLQKCGIWKIKPEFKDPLSVIWILLSHLFLTNKAKIFDRRVEKMFCTSMTKK